MNRHEFKRNGSGWDIWGRTLTEALHNAVRGALTKIPDEVLNIESHFFDVTLSAGTCELELDLGTELWLNKQRWSRLIKEYVPRDSLERFLDQCVEIYNGEARKGATANMMFHDPIRYEKKHRWGGCLMGATFRAETEGYHMLTFYSRTSYMGYIGLLDAAIGQAMMQQAGIPLEHISFRWHLTSMQLHCFKTLPFIFSQPDLFDKLQQCSTDARRIDGPTWANITKWYLKILAAWEEHGDEMIDHEKYGPFKRIKRRWMEHMGHSTKNVPPPVPVNTLTLEKAE